MAAGDFAGMTISSQLEVLRQAVGGQRVSLIGSSLGGYVGALYAARRPAEVNRLVLLAPAFGFARRWSERLGEEQVNRWRQSGSLEIDHYGTKQKELLRYGFLENALHYEEFPAVTQPTLILHGQHDDIVPAALSQDYARRHQHVEFRLLASDHGLVDVADEIFEGSARFLLPNLS